MNEPDTMYWAGGSAGKEPNGIYLYDGIPNIAEFSRTDKEINEPENGYLSVIRQRELAAEHDFPLGLITDIVTEYNNITINHDARYYAYPVYLLSEADDKIVLRTTLGKMYDRVGIVTYSIKKDGRGEWYQDIEELVPATEPDAPVKKTFDVQYYLKDDLAGMTAGAAYPFENGICADNTGLYKMDRSAGCTGFFASEHKDLPDDLVEALRQYSDGDDLRYDLGGRLPALRTYKLFDDTELLQKAYRVNDEYLITVNDAGNIQFYRKSSSYTYIRKAIELLWKNHDNMYPFEVFAVREDRDYDPEYLMIVATDSYDEPGERVDVLGQIKQMLDEAGVLDWDGGFVFMTPGQLRREWTPAKVTFTADMPECVRFDNGVYVKASEGTSFEGMKEILVGLGVTGAENYSIHELWGERVTEYEEMLDLFRMPRSSLSFLHYNRVSDDIVVRQEGIEDDGTNYTVYVRNMEISIAADYAVRLRKFKDVLRDVYGAQIRQVELVIDAADSKKPYKCRIIIHADEKDREILKDVTMLSGTEGMSKTEFAE